MEMFAQNPTTGHFTSFFLVKCGKSKISGDSPALYIFEISASLKEALWKKICFKFRQCPDTKIKGCMSASPKCISELESSRRNNEMQCPQ